MPMIALKTTLQFSRVLIIIWKHTKNYLSQLTNPENDGVCEATQLDYTCY